MIKLCFAWPDSLVRFLVGALTFPRPFASYIHKGSLIRQSFAEYFPLV